MTASPFTGHSARDPEHLLQRTLDAWNERGDVWIFGYASLIWRPEFEAAEERAAKVHGWHRALAMRSRVNRGTPECPGLVFALIPGGSCQGRAYRIEQARVETELRRLWAREMPSGVYDPKWLSCRTPQGIVRGLAFTLSKRSPNHAGALPEGELMEILRTANGRYGSTLSYLVETARSLRTCGIRDRDVERMVALARRHALTAG